MKTQNLFLILIALIACIVCNSKKTTKQKTNQAKIVKKPKRKLIKKDTVTIAPNWKDKETLHLKIKKTKIQQRSGLKQKATSISNIEVKLKKAKNKTWEGTWAIKSIKTVAIKNPYQKKLAQLFKNFTYKFTLDSEGVVISLNNWKEIQTKAYKAIDIMIKEMKRIPGANYILLQNVKKSVTKLIDSKEKIETYLMPQINLYFALGGLTITKNDTLKATFEFVHPFTQEVAKQNLESIYKRAYTDSTCDITLRQYIDQKEMSKIIQSTINKVANKNAVNEFNKKSRKYDLNIKSNYNISFKTGLVQKVYSKKVVSIGNDKQIDKTVIIKL